MECIGCVCRALEESNHPTRWYPFAVTGINVTAFLIELIDERLLDVKPYRLAANGKDDEDLNAGLTQLHDVYGAWNLLSIRSSKMSLFLDLMILFPHVFSHDLYSLQQALGGHQPS